MRLVLIHAPGLAIDTVRTQNVGYDYEQVVDALDRLDAQGHSHTEEGGTGLSDERLAALKQDARDAFTVASPKKKKGRKIGNSFGTNKYPWQDFGTGIPVLLEYDDGQCVDAYPHEEDDRTVTIMACLTRKTA
jgi:hypothetical protein